MKTMPSMDLRDFSRMSPEDFRKILGSALSCGGDFAEIFLEYRSGSSILMEEDIIKETSENVSMGMGIRVLSGDKTGYGYANDLSPEKIEKTALTAARIAADGSPGFPAKLNRLNYAHNHYPVKKHIHSVPLDSKIDLVRRTYEAALNTSPKIVKVKSALIDQIQEVTIINSDGLLISDSRPLVKLTCLAIAEKGIREAGYSGGGGRVGLEYFSDTLTPEEIGKDAAGEALHLLEAVHPPAGEMPVVLSPGHSGVFIHEAVGHLLEADFIRKKTSIFWDKKDHMVASESVNIYDDPTIPYFRGTYNIDDEGTIPRKTSLIKNGRMVGLLSDLLSSRVMKSVASGHGRRQNYSCIPIPRMANTYIDRGEYTPEEIIAGVKKGFYADKFQGGQVEDSGKFTFSVSSGFLIEDGRITAPVKQATLIGTNLEILKRVEKVGSDLKFGYQTGTCGKEGQEAPVTDGCPTIKISRMIVGGRR